GKPRLRYLILLDLSLLFWMISYWINIISDSPQMTGTWQIVSLMGMTLLLFSFIAAFVDYIRNADEQ
ncbi:MAG TPA: histidine kinase N-terminal 7TM domain-containing protein, partial [Methanospirillum sp.]|nr:histidine kinase N-terminal 7TM domain-containing protein [Methanospirillum sp.]